MNYWSCHRSAPAHSSCLSIAALLCLSRNRLANFCVYSLMPQTQLRRTTPAHSRLKSAFWGRDAIVMAFMIYLLGLTLVSFLLVNPLMPWLGELLGTSHLGFFFLFMIIFSVPTTLAAWITARLVPRWCLVPWATLNTAFFVLRILPELRVEWLRGEWGQFGSLAVACLAAFGLQTWVLFATRRRVTQRLSTACG